MHFVHINRTGIKICTRWRLGVYGFTRYWRCSSICWASSPSNHLVVCDGNFMWSWHAIQHTTPPPLLEDIKMCASVKCIKCISIKLRRRGVLLQSSTILLQIIIMFGKIISSSALQSCSQSDSQWNGNLLKKFHKFPANPPRNRVGLIKLLQIDGLLRLRVSLNC